MNLLILALLLAQPVPQPVKGPNGPINLIVGSVTQNGMTLTVTGGGGGGSPGGVSGNLQINDGAGGFGAYAGTACTGAQLVQSLNANGGATCYQLRLNQLANPNGDTAFTYPSGTKMLWTFTGSTDEAFSIHGDGAFTGAGDLVHINKTGTGSSAGADALHVEVTSDTNMTGLRVTMVNATRDAINTNGVVTAPTFAGALTGNASTATALAALPSACSAGQAPLGILANGNATGCFTPAGTYTLPAASTTLGGVKMAAACGAGNHVSSIGALGELTCTADSGGGGAPTTAQYWVGAADAGLSAEKDLSGFTGLVLNTAGTPSSKATNTCTNQFPRSDNASGVWTCATIGSADLPAASTTLGAVKMAASCAAGNHVASIGAGGELTCTADSGGGGGSPAGASGTVQYNNAGAFGGATNVSIDTNGNLKLPTISDPGASASGTLTIYGRAIANRMMPKFVGPSGVDSAIQPALFQNRVILWTPGTGTAPLYSGQTGTIGATASHPTPATTNLGTSISRTQFATSTTAGNTSGIRSPLATVLFGNSTARGGFFYNARFNQGSLHTTGVQKAVGLSASTAALAGEGCTGFNDFIGMCLDAADASWQFSRRTGAGAATKVALVAAAANQVFDLTMFAPPGSTTLYVRVLQYADNGSATTLLDTSYSTSLPAVTTFLGLTMQVRNGALAAAHNIAMSRIYLESDF